MHSLTGAEAPRVVVPPRSEETGIPDIPYSSVEPAFEFLFVVTVRDRKNKMESSVTVATMTDDRLALNAGLRRQYGYDWHDQDIISVVKLDYKPVCGQCASFFESRIGGYCCKHEQPVSTDTKMCRLGVMNVGF